MVTNGTRHAGGSVPGACVALAPATHSGFNGKFEMKSVTPPCSGSYAAGLETTQSRDRLNVQPPASSLTIGPRVGVGVGVGDSAGLTGEAGGVVGVAGDEVVGPGTAWQAAMARASRASIHGMESGYFPSSAGMVKR